MPQGLFKKKKRNSPLIQFTNYDDGNVDGEEAEPDGDCSSENEMIDFAEPTKNSDSHR